MSKHLDTKNYVVDWNMDELYEKTNEAHDKESNEGGKSDFFELIRVWIVTFAKKKFAVFDKSFKRIED